MIMITSRKMIVYAAKKLIDKDIFAVVVITVNCEVTLVVYEPILRITSEPIRPTEDAVGTAKTFPVSQV